MPHGLLGAITRGSRGDLMFRCSDPDTVDGQTSAPPSNHGMTIRLYIPARTGSSMASFRGATWLWVKTNGTILVGGCTTHFRAYFSGWIGMFIGGTIWILTDGHIPCPSVRLLPVARCRTLPPATTHGCARSASGGTDFYRSVRPDLPGAWDFQGISKQRL